MPVTLKDSRSSLATDPLRNFKFKVIIDWDGPDEGKKSNFTGLGFMSASGFTMNTEVIPYREGGNNTTTRKLPGQTDFSPITLSRGIIAGEGGVSMFNWMKTIFYVIHGAGNKKGKAAGRDVNFRTDIKIHVLEHPVTKWGSDDVKTKLKIKVFNAWPSTLTYSDLDAGGNAVMIQSMVLQHEGWAVKHASVNGDVSDFEDWDKDND